MTSLLHTALTDLTQRHMLCWLIIQVFKSTFSCEYMSSLLSSVSSDQDKIQLYISECQRLEIEVLPPDVNTSFADFTPDGQNIRFA